MSTKIVKTLTVTRISYVTAEVIDGAAVLVPHPDAVYRGMLTEKRALKLLKESLGKDAAIVITKFDAGQHRYEMSFEDFVLHATMDGEAQDENSDADEISEDDTPDDGASEEDVPDNKNADVNDSSDNGDTANNDDGDEIEDEGDVSCGCVSDEDEPAPNIPTEQPPWWGAED